MLKSLVDLDTRKVTSYLLTFAAIAIPLSNGEGPSLTHVIPDAWIPYAQADLAITGWLATVIAGIHNASALMSPRENNPPVVVGALVNQYSVLIFRRFSWHMIILWHIKCT